MFVSKKRARSLSYATMLLGFAFVIFFNSWWPGILLSVGLSFVLRNLLLGQWHDFFVNAFVFGGIFTYYNYGLPINWTFFIPVALLLAAIYILYREFFIGEQETESEREEELNREIQEDEID